MWYTHLSARLPFVSRLFFITSITLPCRVILVVFMVLWLEIMLVCPPHASGYQPAYLLSCTPPLPLSSPIIPSHLTTNLFRCICLLVCVLPFCPHLNLTWRPYFPRTKENQGLFLPLWKSFRDKDSQIRPTALFHHATHVTYPMTSCDCEKIRPELQSAVFYEMKIRQTVVWISFCY